jgi:hypothetical protein
MTLDELEMEANRPTKPCRSCEPSVESVLWPEDKLPQRVFLRADEEGKMRFMTITQDGRVVPCEDW